MSVAVLTVDQRGSRTSADRVPAALAALAARRPCCVPFERTAGDEFQGVLDDPAALPRRRRARCCARTPGTSASASARSRRRCPTRPAPAAARRTSHAREAVTAAKNSPWHLRVAGDRPRRVRALETTLWLWAAVLARRTPRGWEVADLVDEGLSYERGRAPARHHPVGGQPARPGRRHRRGPPGPRARDTWLAPPCSTRRPSHERLRPGHAGARPARGRASSPALVGWTRLGPRIWSPVALVLLAAAAAGRRGPGRRRASTGTAPRHAAGRRWPARWPSSAAARSPPGSSPSSTDGAPGRRVRRRAGAGAARRRLDRRPRAGRGVRQPRRRLARGAGGRAGPQGPGPLPRAAQPGATPAPPSGSSSAPSPACCGPPPAPGSSRLVWRERARSGGARRPRGPRAGRTARRRARGRPRG